MTDRVHSLTVVLDKDMREDDVQEIVNAILMFRRVVAVKPNVSDVVSFMAATRARAELQEKVMQVIRDVNSA